MYSRIDTNVRQSSRACTKTEISLWSLANGVNQVIDLNVRPGVRFGSGLLSECEGVEYLSNATLGVVRRIPRHTLSPQN